ncbi:MAG: hypothetical protein EYC70_09340 [Planctomycetota bacterium]|nr:MAG: hypothetical protein EYC70_09340 [Planctomycetota bacterium]
MSPAALLLALAAQVAQLEVHAREPVLDGRAFGAAGAYEKLSGIIHFAFDPEDPRNAAIVDLDLAPRNAAGRVEAGADFLVLRPADPAKGSGTALLEVSNRGGKAMLRYFCAGRGGADLATAEDFGDGWLLRQGLTLIWVGWQFDVPQQRGLLRLRVPRARNPDGTAITGLVRCDWVVDDPAPSLALGHRDHVAYAPAAPGDPSSLLTLREGRLAPRTPVPRDAWRFAQEGNAWVIQGDQPFQAGSIYELVYRAADPAVAGLGFAAVRDTILYAKTDRECPFPVRRGIAFGVSQTGRFLRHFLYQGCNDAGGAPAFDGMLIHTAGAGRGSFNHRFAQPSRDAHRYSSFFYPTDLFPFSGRAQRDPLTGRRDGLLSRVLAGDTAPKIFYTNTGYEYWGRAAALLHTSLDGSADVEPLPNERIYHLRSTQHFPVPYPRTEAPLPGVVPRWRGNPADFLRAERALLRALLDWVERDAEPPPSACPRIAEGTLVAIPDLAFPAIPGLAAPQAAQEAYRCDFGPRWEAGIIDLEPPALGPAYAVLVPQVDALGNELGGVPSLEILAPLATYAPWHLRSGSAGGNGEMDDFYGTFIPLARTAGERTQRGDPRPSIDELWPSRDTYAAAVDAAIGQLIEDRFLLAEDRDPARAQALRTWDWLHADGAGAR